MFGCGVPVLVLFCFVSCSCFVLYLAHSVSELGAAVFFVLGAGFVF